MQTKHLLLAATTLTAAGAAAQMSMPRIDTRSPFQSSVEAAYGKVTSTAGDYSGSAIAARLYFYGNAYALVSRNDVTFDLANLGAHQFAYGIGSTEAWGQGTISASYAKGKVSGDIAGVDQHILSLGYELGLAPSLTAGLTVTHTFNAGSVKDVTATVFSARYSLAGGISLVASYAAEDTLLAQSGAKHTWTVGARYSF